MYSLSEFRQRLLVVKRLLTIYHGGFIMALLLASLATFGVHLLQSDNILFYMGSFVITLIGTIKLFDWLIGSRWLRDRFGFACEHCQCELLLHHPDKVDYEPYYRYILVYLRCPRCHHQIVEGEAPESVPAHIPTVPEQDISNPYIAPQTVQNSTNHYQCRDRDAYRDHFLKYQAVSYRIHTWFSLAGLVLAILFFGVKFTASLELLIGVFVLAMLLLGGYCLMYWYYLRGQQTRCPACQHRLLLDDLDVVERTGVCAHCGKIIVHSNLAQVAE
jgi:hypothetical protein